MKNIVLIGMPGTGKSVVGQALASRLGYEFVDVDDLIVERAGKTLPEILRQDGLEAFYKIEGQVGCDLNRQHTVIATGGSMVLYPEAMAHLKQDSVVVWLQTPFTQIQERMPADLYDRGRNKRVEFLVFERAHNLVLLLVLHFAVQQPEPYARHTLFQFVE